MKKQITKEDILSNRFIKYTNKEKTTFRIKYPTRTQAEKMLKFTLCIFIGVDTLRKRSVDGAVKNANFFLERKTKEEILDQFFPQNTEFTLNDLF